MFASFLMFLAKLKLMFVKKPVVKFEEILPPREKVWVSPTLIGFKEERYHKVGAVVQDKYGRMCRVVRQGKLGGLKRMIQKEVEQHVSKLLGMEAAKGPVSTKFQAMTWMFQFKMWKHRMMKRLTTGWTWDRVALWLFVIFPCSMGLGLFLVEVVK